MATTVRRLFRIRPRDIAYLSITVSSYDGAGVVRTVDPEEAVIEVLMAPGCEKILLALFRHLAEEEGVPIEPAG
ncbi:MAG: DUF4911 domain-containing protein [Deltaproteobacteria bacterium]|nr:DUF4911 domain-containing protein [Deltaproteobacteria bacterium]MBW1951167.1 DUF4911 domain-containing protein [Deltaproteobacteria bacterium]MBW2009162.1 DUF4911 domain-containing protein [Deltaproteobacteria bacterium]MBW2104122.1 DUF4911 domain-containing protein [Deltaproteobacteria bacterium]MBW2349240.1 DUF4911 domain-containing protein [Deltaproteobacteria bacterium]